LSKKAKLGAKNHYFVGNLAAKLELEFLAPNVRNFQLSVGKLQLSAQPSF